MSGIVIGRGGKHVLVRHGGEFYRVHTTTGESSFQQKKNDLPKTDKAHKDLDHSCGYSIHPRVKACHHCCSQNENHYLCDYEM